MDAYDAMADMHCTKVDVQLPVETTRLCVFDRMRNADQMEGLLKLFGILLVVQ